MWLLLGLLPSSPRAFQLDLTILQPYHATTDEELESQLSKCQIEYSQLLTKLEKERAPLPSPTETSREDILSNDFACLNPDLYAERKSTWMFSICAYLELRPNFLQSRCSSAPCSCTSCTLTTSSPNVRQSSTEYSTSTRTSRDISTLSQAPITLRCARTRFSASLMRTVNAWKLYKNLKRRSRR